MAYKSCCHRIIVCVLVVTLRFGCPSLGHAQGGGPPGGPVVALAIDPSNAATLYVVTGSLNGEGGAGVFKSTDGGASWVAAGSGLPQNFPINTIVIDPSNPATLSAGAGSSIRGPGGVFKSTDGGASWEGLSFGPQFGLSQVVQALAIDPSNTATVYAGTATPGLPGVFKTTNGGASWSRITRGLLGNGVQTLAIDPSNTDTVYAGTGNAVFKSTDGGADWTLSWDQRLANVLALAIDPSNIATIYAGAVVAPLTSAITDVGAIFKSTDAGISWAAVRSTARGVAALAIDPSNPATIYAATTVGGILKSTDGGASWLAVNSGFTS